EDPTAAGDPPDRCDQLRPSDRLRDVAARPAADDTDDVLGRVGHRQGEELDVRQGGTSLEYGPAATARQMHVEQHDVRLRCPDDGDGGVDVLRFSDDGDAIAQFPAHTGAG